MRKKLIDWVIDNGNNLGVVVFVTLLFPKVFLRALMEENDKKKSFVKNKKSVLTISFDCDYPEDVAAIPAVVRMLSRHEFKTSFACVGHWIEKFPKEHAMILEYGHEIVNHTYSHPDNEILNPGRKFKEISREEKKEEVERCHDICKRILHYEPIGCRIPHFKNLFTPEIYSILKELGYRYSSSTLITNTKTAGFPFKTKEGIIEFPLTSCPKHPFTVFDTWHSFNTPRLFYKLVHRTEDQYIGLFKYLIDIAIETNSYLNIYIDPLDIPKMNRFGEILEYIKARQEKLWVASYKEIVNEVMLI